MKWWAYTGGGLIFGGGLYLGGGAYIWGGLSEVYGTGIQIKDKAGSSADKRPYSNANISR